MKRANWLVKSLLTHLYVEILRQVFDWLQITTSNFTLNEMLRKMLFLGSRHSVLTNWISTHKVKAPSDPGVRRWESIWGEVHLGHGFADVEQLAGMNNFNQIHQIQNIACVHFLFYII